MKSWSSLVVATATILLFGHHCATAKMNCRPPTAEDARLVVESCRISETTSFFNCCGISRSFIYSCSNCATAEVTDRLLESRTILGVLDNAAKTCNFNLSQVIIQELDCLGVKDWKFGMSLNASIKRDV